MCHYSIHKSKDATFQSLTIGVIIRALDKTSARESEDEATGATFEKWLLCDFNISAYPAHASGFQRSRNKIC